MSSARLPGKVLAPIAGRPMIAHVLSRLAEAVPRDAVVLVTSTDATDDPLARYAHSDLGFAVSRGDLKDVVKRFQQCLRAHPFDRFARISGDSPAIDPDLVAWMLNETPPDADLVSNVVRRTFPPGQSVEVIRTRTFLELDSAALSAEEREHVTPHFYQHRNRYRVRAVESGDASLAQRRLVVDTLDDLLSMERILANGAAETRGFAAHARLVDE